MTSGRRRGARGKCSMHSSSAVALFLVVLAPAAPASTQSPGAGTPTSAPVREVTATIGSAVNPAGLMARVEVNWRRSISRSKSRALSDAHFSFGVSPELTPSYVRAAIWAELAPVSFFGVRAGVEPAVYFGTFSSLVSFADVQQPFDSKTMRARRDEAETGTALRMYVRPSFRLKVGRVGGEVNAQVERWESSAAGPFFLEPSRNTLVSVRSGRVTCLSTAVLYDVSRVLGVGGAYELTQVQGAVANRIQRAGPLVTYVPRFAVPALGRPTITAVAGTYLQDPHRRGQMFAALGLGFALKRADGSRVGGLR